MPASPSLPGERASPRRDAPRNHALYGRPCDAMVKVGRSSTKPGPTLQLGDTLDASEPHEHDKAHDQQDPDGKHS